MPHRQKAKQSTQHQPLRIKEKWDQWEKPQWLTDLSRLWNLLPHFHRKALKIVTSATVILMIIPFPEGSSDETSVTTVAQRVQVGLDTTPLDQAQVAVTKPVDSSTRTQQSAAALVRSAWVSYTVKDGDTLSAVFRANNLSLSDLTALIGVEGIERPLSNIRPGQLIRFKLNKEGQLDILQLEKSGQSIMFFRLSEGGFGRSQ